MYAIIQEIPKMTPNLVEAKPVSISPAAAKRAKLMPAVAGDTDVMEVTEEKEAWRTNLRHDASLSEPSRPDWWWTGKKPQDAPGYVEAGHLSSLALPVRVPVR